MGWEVHSPLAHMCISIYGYIQEARVLLICSVVWVRAKVVRQISLFSCGMRLHVIVVEDVMPETVSATLL